MKNFENIMENEAFAPKEQMLHFNNIFKNMIFQRSHKELLWRKGLIVRWKSAWIQVFTS